MFALLICLYLIYGQPWSWSPEIPSKPRPTQFTGNESWVPLLPGGLHRHTAVGDAGTVPRSPVETVLSRSASKDRDKYGDRAMVCASVITSWQAR
jgi:hypothetical protein